MASVEELIHLNDEGDDKHRHHRDEPAIAAYPPEEGRERQKNQTERPGQTADEEHSDVENSAKPGCGWTRKGEQASGQSQMELGIRDDDEDFIGIRQGHI